MRLAPGHVWLFVLPVILMGIGLINLYSIENFPAPSWSSNFYKQSVWAVLTVVGMIVVSLIEGAFWRYLAYVIYGGALGLMVLTVVIGREVNGTRAWLEIGGLRLQSSEFAKVATALALARFFEGRPDFSWRRGWERFIVFGLVALPMGLALLQKDTGTALTFGAFVVPLYRYGMSGWMVVAPLVVGGLGLVSVLYGWKVGMIVGTVLGVLSYWWWRRWGWAFLVGLGLVGWGWLAPKAYERILAPHQRRRIEVLLDPYKDPRGSGWNVIQVRIAIEAGGLWGRGYGQGLQSKLDFIPQRHTDFAFCGIAEEWGWVGSTIVIGLYLSLLWVLSLSAEKSQSTFGLILGYSLVGILGLHFVINLGMILGLLPVIGIPLPFMSYGGSSWVAVGWGIGVMQRIYRERSLRLFG
jgi:rod shape determining protein RodA